MGSAGATALAATAGMVRWSGAASEKVSFRGFVTRPELIDFYYGADVFAFAPIWNEGLRSHRSRTGGPVVATRNAVTA